MEVKTITTDGLFRVFTACPLDPKTFILDVRPQKEFVKQHVMQAYCIRLAANGKALLDYSKNSYDVSWSPDCWWDKAIIVYGDSKLKRDHPVVAFLANDKHAKSLAIYREGFEGFAKAYPFLCSASVKNNAAKRYPGEIVPKVLYLGDWEHAQQTERMDELNIRRVLTIHNNPENMQLPARFKHLRLQLADVDTQDVSKFFAPSYTFIEEARAASEAVLVHCGAGVSRSAALCIAYLMRRFTWPASRARDHCRQRRSLVNPNQGFWRSLCAFEEQLGITDRSDPADTEDFHGADAPALLAEGAAGEKVSVRFMPAGQRTLPNGAAANAHGARDRAAAPERPAASSGARDDPSGRGDRRREDREGHLRDGRSRDRGGDRDWERDRHRRDGRDRDSERHRHRDSDKERDTERDRDRERGRGRERGRDRSREDRRHSSTDRERHGGEHERGVKRSRDESREGRRARRNSREAADKPNAAAENGKAEPIPAAAQGPGVILQVSKEGKVVGTMELGLHSIADKVMFGRAPTCDVVLEHLSISRQHAALSADTSGNLFITDLGSGHGTNVEGVWIRPNEPRLLTKDATFKIAASSREYKVIQIPKDRKAEAQD